jgi:hypothetical protein
MRLGKRNNKDMSSDRSAFSLSSAATNGCGSSTASSKPLPLKQRTSSVSDKRDFSHNTWISLLRLIKIREYFISTDNFSIWRRHLAWAFEDGQDLRQYMTQRYASTMVFMSLLLSTELGVLFNSAKVTTEVRFNLHNSNHQTVAFWAGLLIIISALLTLLSLISTFTAWAMVSAIDGKNAHCILRSSIGQYAAELPGRLVVFSIYSFLTSFMLFFFLLLPVGFWSILLLVSTALLFVHVISVFSCFGRIIMHTGAMGTSRIFSSEYEGFLEPHSLHTNLRNKAECNLAHSTSIMRQYRSRQQPIDRYLASDQEMYDHLSGLNIDRQYPNHLNNSLGSNRTRSGSIVRFADEEQGQGEGSNGESTRPKNGTSGNGSVSYHFKYGSISSDDPFRTNLTPLSEASHSSHISSSFSDLGVDDPPAPNASNDVTVTVGRGNLERPPSTIFTESSSSSPINSAGLPTMPPSTFNNRPTAVNVNVGRHTSNISSMSNISNVSNVSLEQWLQGSAGSTPRQSRPGVTVNDFDGENNTGRNNNDDSSDYPISYAREQRRNAPIPAQSETSRASNRSHLSPQSKKVHTAMSESEQFEYDYGAELYDLNVSDDVIAAADGRDIHDLDDENNKNKISSTQRKPAANDNDEEHISLLETKEQA